MNLYYIEFANNEGEVLCADFEVAESPAHCIASIAADTWRGKHTHIHSIEHIYKFKDYKDCLKRLEICINYAFHQIQQLSIMTSSFADTRISGKPEDAREDQAHGCTLSYAADLIGDKLKEAKKYIEAIENLTHEQRCKTEKIRTPQNLTQ